MYTISYYWHSFQWVIIFLCPLAEIGLPRLTQQGSKIACMALSCSQEVSCWLEALSALSKTVSDVLQRDGHCILELTRQNKTRQRFKETISQMNIGLSVSQHWSCTGVETYTVRHRSVMVKGSCCHLLFIFSLVNVSFKVRHEAEHAQERQKGSHPRSCIIGNVGSCIFGE